MNIPIGSTLAKLYGLPKSFDISSLTMEISPAKLHYNLNPNEEKEIIEFLEWGDVLEEEWVGPVGQE